LLILIPKDCVLCRLAQDSQLIFFFDFYIVDGQNKEKLSLCDCNTYVIMSRKRKWGTTRAGITYGPIAERDRMRIEYLNRKIWKNDITYINMI
jgi:hypothetical protein